MHFNLYVLRCVFLLQMNAYVDANGRTEAATVTAGVNMDNV